MTRAEGAHRAGVVAILGPPNAGKSALLNRLLGQKLAIVTAKPQTTRSRLLGILTREDAQILLLDTPGRHAASRPLNRALNDLVDEAASDCDVALLLVDLARGWQPEHSGLRARLTARQTPFVVVGTKLDRPQARRAPWPLPEAQGAPGVRTSARTGAGLEVLIEEIVQRLPESPRLYPEDELSDRPVRFLAAELVREAAIEELAQELPYVLAVEVVEFVQERPDLVRIRADLLVERASQKRIAIGTGGAVIKRIGVRARREIEKLVGAQVHLELWVKREPRWSRNPKRLKSLGYS